MLPQVISMLRIFQRSNFVFLVCAFSSRKDTILPGKQHDESSDCFMIAFSKVVKKTHQTSLKVMTTQWQRLNSWMKRLFLMSFDIHSYLSSYPDAFLNWQSQPMSTDLSHWGNAQERSRCNPFFQPREREREYTHTMRSALKTSSIGYASKKKPKNRVHRSDKSINTQTISGNNLALHKHHTEERYSSPGV